MIQARWLIIFFAVLGMSVPSFAIDWSLGGFPSYLRTRARVIGNATAINNDETISFVDTTLRLTPQLGLSDAITVRAQVDVASNMIWGGQTSHFFGGEFGQDDSVVLSDLRPSDRFNGAVLTGEKAVDDDYGFFTVRMLHADIVLPNNLGFVRIGRQPFDWGLGILANGGHDPHSDLGFVVDRALWLKSFPAGAGTFTLVLVSDVFSNGHSLFAAESGVGYDILAAAGIYNQQMGDINVTVGGYAFPYLHQENIFSPGFGYDFDVERTSLYSGLLVLKASNWSFTYEVQMFGGGELTNPELGALPAGEFEFDYAFDMAGRLEFYPSTMAQVSTIGLEAGWAQGDDGSTALTIEGNALPFSPAYNVDNLLFKHVIPTVYQIEGSVINAIYVRAYANMQLAENLGFTPQVLIAWNDETNAVSAFDSNYPGVADFGNGVGNRGISNTAVDEYLGTEIEGTLSWTLHPGANLDFIGSLVLAGDGLTDLIEAHGAANEVDVTADDTIWAFQTRLMIYIDQFMK